MMIPDSREDLHIARVSGIPYESNMNNVVKTSLEGDWEYWINLDQDQAPIKNPLDLVFLD